jgi:hypothetical protein
MWLPGKVAPVVGLALAAGLALPVTAPAGNARVDGGADGLQAMPPDCGSWTADYLLAARLRLADTPFGAGDGVFDIGPGRLRIRVTQDGAPATPPKVELLTYEMREHFAVSSSVLFFHVTVTTRTETRVTPDARGVVATGALRGREIVWSTPVRGYRADGTLHCEGSGCGMSGAPPKGTSEFHLAPGPVQFSRFVFGSASLDTLHMDPTKVAHTEVPQQTAYVTFAGRRTALQCIDK